ncbi:MAG TPA: hypothetical protein VEU53_07445 [Stellaceae bacterium]|nr:hypothetical protein [Stellaceae bacterium]
MTKLGLLTAAAALIALSPPAMAQSSNAAISNSGGFIVAQAQGESVAQLVSPMQAEESVSKWDEGDKRTWQEENAQVPKDAE